MNPNKQVVAAFDFDGTITTRDALLPFFFNLKGPLITLFKLLKKLPILTGFVLGLISRQKAKEALLKTFLAGISKEALHLQGMQFAKGSLKNLVIPKALERIRWHQTQGHRCVVISASLDFFLLPWTQEQNIRDLICSELEWDSQGKATGKLKGINCWGPEKKRRLLELLGPKDHFVLYAYGDSRGDKELLELADHPFYKKLD